MKTKTCDCGQEIVFGRLEVNAVGGKPVSRMLILIEFTTPVYRIVREEADGTPILHRVWLEAEKEPLCVNHFRTCPKAREFTRKA